MEGLQKILSLKTSLNLGLSDTLKTAFSIIVPINRSLIQDQKILDPYWLAGFTSGEGCFRISIFKSATKLGEAVSLIFKISQHTRDEQLIKSFVEYFGCDINEKIIPF